MIAQLKLHLQATVLTMTKRAATFINETVITCTFKFQPLALIVMDNQRLCPIHKSMKLMLTQNCNKNIGFVNGQFVTVIGAENQTILAQMPHGNLLNIHPITKLINDEQVTVYPCLPGYV